MKARTRRWVGLVSVVLACAVGCPRSAAAEEGETPAPIERNRAADDLLDAIRNGGREDRNAAFRELLRMGRRAGPILLEALETDNPAVQAVTGRMLAELGIREAGMPLVRLLASEETQVRQAAAAALGRLRDPRAVQPLLERLPQKPWRAERCEILLTLGRVGEPRAVPFLDDQLKDEDPMVQNCAAGALGLLGDGRGLALALDNSRSEDAGVQRSAVEALGRIGDGRATGPLLEILWDGAPSSRAAAHIALRSIQIRGIPSEEKVRILRGELDEEAPVIQGWAARELGDLGDAQAVAALKDGLVDGEGHPRWPVLVQLYRLGIDVGEGERQGG